MLTYERVVRRMLPDVEFHQNRYAAELDETIPRGCRWLDIGAGTRVHGGWLRGSEESLSARAAQLVGCDVEIEHLRGNLSLDGRVGADAANLPFRDGSFDIVTANMVLEHLEDPLPVFREIARVLVSGGRFIFLTPHRGHPAVRWAALMVSPRVRRLLAARIERRDLEHVFLTHYVANDTGAISRLADATGLRVVRLEAFPSFPLCRSPMPAVVLECLWIRMMAWQPLCRRFSSNLIGCLQRGDEAGAR
jgi:ubiquinone/menaquinone biosynthesis C-methylase UbiE